MQNRTLMQYVEAIKTNAHSFARAGACNKAIDDFIARLEQADEKEKEEVLVFLKKELKELGDFDYGRSGTGPYFLMSSMGLSKQEMQI